MVTALKVSKNLNSTTLKELLSSLRSHQIDLKEDGPQNKGKSVALKSKGKSEKTIVLQAEQEESKEDCDEEDEVSLLSRRVTNFGNKDKRSSQATEEQVDILSQPLDRKSLKLKKKLSNLSARSLAITRRSVSESPKKSQRRSSSKKRTMH